MVRMYVFFVVIVLSLEQTCKNEAVKVRHIAIKIKNTVVVLHALLLCPSIQQTVLTYF